MLIDKDLLSLYSFFYRYSFAVRYKDGKMLMF